MELAKRRVLVTGGAGFVGSHLADRLLEIGCRVVVLDNFDGFYGGKERNVAHNLNRDGYSLVRGDILDFDALVSLMRDIDVVFHEAAQPGVRQCIADPVRSHDVNVTGTLNVLMAARARGVKRVVYASSSSVYGVPKILPMSEEHPTNPTSPYGVSKLAAEKYCLAFHQVYGLDVVCLRYFSVYGSRGRPDQVVYSFAEKAWRGESPIIYGDGAQTRDFTYISDVVDATVLAAESEDGMGEVFNIGYGSEVSINEVARKVIDGLGSSVTPKHLERYSGDFPRTMADNRRAKELLDWQPKVRFDEGLKSFLEWFRFNSQAYQLDTGT